MPTATSRDHTASDLASAAGMCRDAAELLGPASAELTGVVNELRYEHPFHARKLERAAEGVEAAAHRLEIGTVAIREAADDVDRTYISIAILYRRIFRVAGAVAVVLSLVRLLPRGDVPDLLGWLTGMAWAFATGVALAQVILERHARRART